MKHILDLFAGTGALSFEALSRGADSAVLMESDPKARQSIQKNIFKTSRREQCG